MKRVNLLLTITVLVISALAFSSASAQDNASASAIDTSVLSSVSADETQAFEQQARDTENNNREMIVVPAPWETGYELYPGTVNNHVASFIAQCNEGATINKVTVFSDSVNAPSIVRNLRVLLDGNQIGQAADLAWQNGRYGAKFSGPFVCTENPSHFFEIAADVVTNATGSIRLAIDSIKLQQGRVINVPISGAVHPIRQVAAHPAGTNVYDGNDDMWLITNNGERRKYTSLEAFNSYPFNNTNQFVPANAGDLALTIGDPILPQEGRPYVQYGGPDQGQVYLISGNNKHQFASVTVFQAMGFSFSTVGNADLRAATTSYMISSIDERHPKGVLINLDGLIFYVTENGRMGIPTLDVFNSYGFSFARVVTATNGDRALPTDGVMQARVPGQLTPR